MTRQLTRFIAHRLKPLFFPGAGRPRMAPDGNSDTACRRQLDAEHRRAMMQCVVDDSFDGIAIVNQDGEIEIINPAAQRILGKTEGEMSGMPIHSFIPWTLEIEEFYAAGEAAEPKRGTRRTAGPFEFDLVRTDGVEMVVELQISNSRLPLTTGAAERRSAPRFVFIYTFRDITERKRIEAAQKRAMAEAVAANRSKTEFLANMSHELRTPLNAVIGFSEVIKTEPFGPLGAPQYADYIEDIFQSGQYLLSVINDILDMSKIEAGEMQMVEAVFGIPHTAESCRRLIAERAQKGQVKLIVEIQDDLPPLRADERMVKQMLLNLLTNAVKFTPQGGEVTLRAEMDKVGCLVISISDTGVGIAPQDMERVLQPFGQADSSLHRAYEGTGLGLPLVKSMAELHGAHLMIDSTLNKGTTVAIRFPVARTVQHREAHAA